MQQTVSTNSSADPEEGAAESIPADPRGEVVEAGEGAEAAPAQDSAVVGVVESSQSEGTVEEGTIALEESPFPQPPFPQQQIRAPSSVVKWLSQLNLNQ